MLQKLLTPLTILSFVVLNLVIGINGRFGSSSCTLCHTIEIDDWKPSFYFMVLPLFGSCVLSYGLDWISLVVKTGIGKTNCCGSRSGGSGETVQSKEELDPKQIQNVTTTFSKHTKRSKFQKWYYSWFLGGSPKTKLWSVVLIVLPTIYICIHSMIFPEGNASANFLSQSSKTKFDVALHSLAATSGYTAITSLSFFMIPVSRHSIFLSAIGWSPIQDALVLHIWAGYVCAYSTLVHIVLYSRMNGIIAVQEGEKFFRGVLDAMFPPRHCFRVAGVYSFLTEAEVNSGCYGYLRNFTGVISAIALLLLVLTSLKIVRRYSYRFFFVSHVMLGSVMLLFAIIHFRYVVLYVLPSLLYYLCTTTPFIIQMLASFFLDKGVRLQQLTIIENSGGCAEMVFPKTAACSEFEDRHANPYVRICVPEISLVWHPFTVASNQDKNTLRILFRQYGHFTSNLVQRLQRINEEEQQKKAPPPIILIDGYYHGSDWVRSALNHDNILIVAGGIGITPFLSMLRILRDKLLQPGMEMRTELRHIHLHWFCREEGLIRYVLEHHFLNLWNINDACEEDQSGQDKEQNFKFHLQISIHHTKRQLGDSTPFPLSSSTKISPVELYVNDPPVEKENNKVAGLNLENKSTLSSTFDLEKSADTAIAISTDITFKGNESNKCDSKANKDFDCKIKEKHDNVVKTFDDYNGVKLDTSRFMPGVRQVHYLIFFSISFLGGVWIHWFIYQNYVIQHHEALFVRGYSTYAVFLWTLIVGTMHEIYYRCCCCCFRSNREAGLERDDFNSHLATEREEANTDNFDDSNVTITSVTDLESHTIPISCSKISRIHIPFTCTVESNLKISLDIQNGRPNLHTVVEEVVEAHHPGMFFCGPSGLLERVQDYIKFYRKEKFGRFGSKCSIYSENFTS